MIDLRLGDCLEVIKTLPDNSVDSVVTDPPYGIRFMGKAWDGADIEKTFARDCSEGDTKTSMSMAAGKYDLSDKGMLAFQEFSFEWAKECYRVLKPGGHLLSFASCRTYHRMAVGIEMAGFEIRDQIQWLFGSGFPKSLNLKDEWQGWGTALKPANEPIVVARKPLEKGLTVAQNVLRYGTGALNIDASRIRKEAWESEQDRLNSSVNHAAKTASQEIPETKESSVIKNAELILNAKENVEPEGISKTATGCLHGQSQAELDINPSEGSNSSIELFGKKTSEQFQKGSSCTTKTTMDSTIESKTSSLCQEGIISDTTSESIQQEKKCLLSMQKERVNVVPQGRWPSNVLLDEEAAKALDEQSGTLKSGARKEQSKSDSIFKMKTTSSCDSSSGGASRFYYVAKASKSERNAGLEGMPAREAIIVNATRRRCEEHDGAVVSGSNMYSCGCAIVYDQPREKTGTSNFHPTVKPIKLMSYLINLVTPPGGVVLEPFMGSGTTGVAAKLLGFSFVGIEREPDYFEIAKRRIENAKPEVKEPDPQLEFPA